MMAVCVSPQLSFGALPHSSRYLVEPYMCSHVPPLHLPGPVLESACASHLQGFVTAASHTAAIV